MEIRYKNIILRDMVESDMEDWIRWYNVETEWADWDAPDMELTPVEPDSYRQEMREMLNVPREGFRSFFELAASDDCHIGMVTSYPIDENYRRIPYEQWGSAAQRNTTLGIVICDSRYWGRGLGTQALAAFVKHHISHNDPELYLQTWSGNIRMIKCAEKLGFTECNRIVGNRNIRGGIYDSLTFRLDLDRFHKYLTENP